MNEVAPDDRRTVGLVLERRDPVHPWGTETWRAAEILEDAPTGGWKELERGDGFERWFAGSVEIGLFRRETEDYRANLGQVPPRVYVVLRAAPAGSAHPVAPFLATANPYEGECYESGEDTTVSSAPMPTALAAWLAGFVERHHVEEPFVKRRQKPKDASRGEDTGRRPRA